MRGLFDPDSKLFSLLNKMTLLMELNLCVLLGCLPIITAGASLCAMHTVLLKVYREEEKHILEDFLRAVKANLKNGTVLWLLFLGYLGALTVFWFFAASQNPEAAAYVLYGLLLATVLGLLYVNWALILLSRYVYTVPQCLKYAVLAWLKYPGSTFVYLVSLLVPGVFFFSLKALPMILLGGITLPHMISTTLYSQVFDQMEGLPPRIPKL